MATTIPRLLDEMAAAQIRTRTELGWLARHMKKTITQGKHGKGGEATTLDAARLLIAALSTTPAAKADDAVKRLGGAVIQCPVEFAYATGPSGRGLITHRLVGAGATFESALAVLIDLRRHPDVHTADLAGNIEQVGIREAVGREWPWMAFKTIPGPSEFENDQVLGRFVFGDHFAYARDRRGLVRETTIGGLAIYRISAALGLKWQETENP